MIILEIVTFNNDNNNNRQYNDYNHECIFLPIDFFDLFIKEIGSVRTQLLPSVSCIELLFVI